MNLSPGRLDALFQALGDPTRRAIVEKLSRGPVTVSEIAAPFDMSLPAVMVHLQKLEAAGLIASEKTGRVRTLTLVTESYTPIRSWLDAQREAWEARLDRMEHFVTRQGKSDAKSEDKS